MGPRGVIICFLLYACALNALSIGCNCEKQRVKGSKHAAGKTTTSKPPVSKAPAVLKAWCTNPRVKSYHEGTVTKKCCESNLGTCKQFSYTSGGESYHAGTFCMATSSDNAKTVFECCNKQTIEDSLGTHTFVGKIDAIDPSQEPDDRTC